MTLFYSEQEDRIKEALSDIDDNVFCSTATAARHYDVKPRRLELRLKGYASRALVEGFTSSPACYILVRR